MISTILCLGYNLKFCDLKSLLMIWNFKIQCVLFALQLFHLHMISVVWSLSCVLSVDSYTVACDLIFFNFFCLDGKHYVRMILCFWFMCVDTKGCKHQHRSAQQMISCKIPFIVISLVSSPFVYDFYKCTY
jgi:hypothetical protein